MKKQLTLFILSITIFFSLNIRGQIGANGGNDPSFNPGDTGFGFGDGANNDVYATAIQSDGKIILGGIFTSYNGVPKNRILRVHSDGKIDTTFKTGSGVTNSVRAIAVQKDGKIIVAGYFTSYNAISKNSIVRLNTDGSLDATFLGSGANNTVNAIALQNDGKIVIGGVFGSYNGTAINRIARLNSNGTLDTTFHVGTGADNSVYSIALQNDDKIIIGGIFKNVNGTAKSAMARLNSNGTLDTTYSPFNPPAAITNSLNAVVIQKDGKIIALGVSYNTSSAVATCFVKRFKDNGTIDSTYNLSIIPNQSVYFAALQDDGKAIITGNFTFINGVSVNRIARLDTVGNMDITFNTASGANNYIYTAALQNDGKIIIGGNFTSHNGKLPDHISRLNNDGTLDPSFNGTTGANDNVNAITGQTDGKLIVAGNFSFYNTASAFYITRLNENGAIDPAFAKSKGTDGPINAIAIAKDGKILIGGKFEYYNGRQSRNIACIKPDGTSDSTFNTVKPGASGEVNAIAIQNDGKIILGGTFGLYNGTVCYNIVRIKPDGLMDLTYIGIAKGTNGTVNAMAMQGDGKLIIAGSFTSFNGTTRNGIARINTDGTIDATFNPNAGSGGKLIRKIVIQADGKIIIAGDFTSYDGIARNHIARLNTNGTLDYTFDPGTGANNNILSLGLQTDWKIIIGGDFTSYDGTSCIRVARLKTNGKIDSTFVSGEGANNTVQSIYVKSNRKIMIGGAFTSYNKIGRNRIARLNNLEVSLNPSTVCFPGDCKNVYSYITGGTPPYSYLWNTGATTDFIKACPDTTTTYSVTVTDSTGAVDTASTIVKVSPPLFIFIDGPTHICKGETIMLTALGSPEFEQNNFLWIPDNQQGATITVSPPSTTVYEAIGITRDQCTLSAQHQVIVDPCTNVEENTGGNDLTIYPNPFENQAIVSFPTELKNARMTIVDELGKELRTVYFSGKQLTVEKGDLGPGIYFLQISLENKFSINKKIIIL